MSQPLPGSQSITVPQWTIFVRAAQIFFAIMILGMSAYGLYWIHFDAWGLALWSSLFTLIVAIYSIVSTRVPSAQRTFNWIAILVLDAAGVIFWLASMADLAATRSAFIYDVTISGCYNNGGGGVCYKRRSLEGRGVEKRGYVAGYGYLNAMSASAGLSAIEMLLFIATLVVFAVNVHQQRERAAGPVTNDKVEAHQMQPQSYTGVPSQQQQQYPEVHPQNYGQPAPYQSGTSTGAQQYPPQQYPPQQQ